MKSLGTKALQARALVLAVEPNTAETQRSATVTVASSAHTVTLTISQAAYVKKVTATKLWETHYVFMDITSEHKFSGQAGIAFSGKNIVTYDGQVFNLE